jgi:hypothetical protein
MIRLIANGRTTASAETIATGTSAWQTAPARGIAV